MQTTQKTTQNRADRWAQEIRSTSYSSGAKLLALTLRTYMSADGTAYPAQETLATDMSGSVSTVKRAAQELIAGGHLSMEFRGGMKVGERGRTNLYRASFPEASRQVMDDLSSITATSDDRSSEGSRQVTHDLQTDQGEQITKPYAPTPTRASSDSRTRIEGEGQKDEGLEGHRDRGASGQVDQILQILATFEDQVGRFNGSRDRVVAALKEDPEGVLALWADAVDIYVTPSSINSAFPNMLLDRSRWIGRKPNVHASTTPEGATP